MKKKIKDLTHEKWYKEALLVNRNLKGSYNCYIFFIGEKIYDKVYTNEGWKIYKALQKVDELTKENKGQTITLCKDYDFGGGWYPFNHRKIICEVEVDE